LLLSCLTHTPPCPPLLPYTTLFRSLAIHDMVYNYSTLAELGKQIETTTVTIDEETGEEKVEVKTETKDIVTININIQTLGEMLEDRKSTRLNSSHVSISYAVFCLKK